MNVRQEGLKLNCWYSQEKMSGVTSAQASQNAECMVSICLCFKIRQKVWLGSFLARKVLLERVQAPPGTLHKNVQYFYKAWAQAEFKVLIRCKSDVGISSESSAFARALSQAQSKLSYLLPQANSPALSTVVLCKSIQAEPEMSFSQEQNYSSVFQRLWVPVHQLIWTLQSKLSLSKIRCIFNKSL